MKTSRLHTLYAQTAEHREHIYKYFAALSRIKREFILFPNLPPPLALIAVSKELIGTNTLQTGSVVLDQLAPMFQYVLTRASLEGLSQ
ncbi:unnamed protein product [Cylicocyclus nassatus]|uniref:Uncharacterized protein n=1 Tax=Cylicocyclus nassatus TaxID=53992 RepID=A0AA36MH79_CYLNA|nr:unnamed protein product [Cylicocyclus nassatus]